MTHKFFKIASGIDILPLVLELNRHKTLWNADPERLSERGPHHDSDDIWIRYKDKTEHVKSGDWTNFSSEHDSVWYPAAYALPAVKKLIFDLMRHVEAERLGGVLIWRLKPGQRILPHEDHGWHVDYYERYNICLQSAPGCEFKFSDQSFAERPGDVHNFDNRFSHEVINTSQDDYVVMCVCLKVHRYSERFVDGRG